jgi:hypothetical protein
MKVRVRVREVQFQERALEHDLLIKVVRARDRVMRLQLCAYSHEAAYRYQPNGPFVHRCSSCRGYAGAMLANWVLESQAALVPPAQAIGRFRHKSSQGSDRAVASAFIEAPN